MFLTKKSVPNTKQKQKNSKALGGWDDEEQDASPTSNYSQTPQQSNKNEKDEVKNIDLLGQGDVIEKSSNTLKKEQNKLVEKNAKARQIDQLYSKQQLAEMKNIECQTKLVQNIIAPSGIRLKQSDVMLSEFLNQAKLMEITLISSLLISNLYPDQPNFQTQARALYAIQYLIKKNVQYSVYFKLHADAIKNSNLLNHQQQKDNYQKIKKNVLGSLGAVVVRPEDRKSGDAIQFVDPGYAVQEESLLGGMNKNAQKNKQKPLITNKKLISPAQLKERKPLQGPTLKTGPKKEKQIEDTNLLQISPIKQKVVASVEFLETEKAETNNLLLLQQNGHQSFQKGERKLLDGGDLI